MKMSLTMNSVISNIFEMIIGFSSGLLIGGAFVALLVVLGVIPRMIQLIRERRFISYLMIALLLGVFSGTFLTFSEQSTNYFRPFLFVWGLFQGIFNGMIAAALVEVLNVFPLLSRRLRLEKYMLALLMALVFGKVIGSLFQWLYFTQ